MSNPAAEEPATTVDMSASRVGKPPPLGGRRRGAAKVDLCGKDGWTRLKERMKEGALLKHPRIYHPSAESVVNQIMRKKRIVGGESCFYPERAHEVALAEAAEVDEKGVPKVSTREQIVHFIHSQRVQAFLLGMLVLDVLIVIAELILPQFQEAEFFVKPEECLIDPSEGSGSGVVGAAVRGFSVLAGGGGGGEDFGIHNATGYYPPETCGVHATCQMPHGIHKAEKILAWFSRGILMMFFLEFSVLIACLRSAFFTLVFSIDAFVVTVSLAVSFWELWGDMSTIGIEIIIILRLWRFARVTHGFGMIIHEEHHKMHEKHLDIIREFVIHELGEAGADRLHAYLDAHEAGLSGSSSPTSPDKKNHHTTTEPFNA